MQNQDKELQELNTSEISLSTLMPDIEMINKDPSDIGMSYQEFMELLPTLEIPPNYIDRYKARGGGQVVALSSYAIRDFCSMLGISVMILSEEETDSLFTVRSRAINRRYGITFNGICDQAKKYPPKRNEKTGEMEEKTIFNYKEIAYVKSQRNALKGLIPEKRIIYVIELRDRSNQAQESKYVEAAKRIEDASKSLRNTINNNSKSLSSLGIDDIIIINKGKELFGDNPKDWGAGQYRKLEEMVKNPSSSGLIAISEGSNQSSEDVKGEDDIPPSVEDDPDAQDMLVDDDNVEISEREAIQDEN